MRTAGISGGRGSLPRGRWFGWALCALALLLLGGPAKGQCEQWLPGDGLPGTNGEVRALLSWDPDGPGPQPPMLVLGGRFSMAGTSLSRSIAGWDGTHWREFGAGLGQNESATVWCLGTYQSRLVAAWNYHGTSTSGDVTQWDGTAWHQLGAGLSTVPSTLIEFDGALLSCGTSTYYGQPTTAPVRRFDGTTWQPFGPSGASLLRLTVLNGQLIGMGTFADGGPTPVWGIRRWTGVDWVPLGSGITVLFAGASGVRVSGTDLYLLGRFVVNGVSCSVVRWDGAVWNAVGSGPPGSGYGSGGDIEVLGSVPIVTIGITVSRWNGTAWQQMGPTTSAGNYALRVFNGELFMGGQFPQINGVLARYIARWDGAAWQPVGPGLGAQGNGTPSFVGVAALREFHGEMIAGGTFGSIGSIQTQAIARYDGTTWRPLGTGLVGVPAQVTALAEYGGELIVGGPFYSAGGTSASGIARWDGTTWRALQPLGVSQNGVAALTVFRGDLIAGGSLTNAGGVAVQHIARWDGSQWHDIGGGTNGNVWGLAVYHDQLVATGGFTIAGGTPASNIASWDGSQWHPLGSGLSSPSTLFVGISLLEYQGELIVGGEFSSAGGTAATLIAAWNGTQWRALGASTGHRVFALASYNGDLVAAGPVAGVATGISRWNGSTWRPFGAGIGSLQCCPSAAALATFRDQLFIGGGFSVVGNAGSVGWARWTDGIPAIEQQPVGANVCVGTSRSLTIAAASSGATPAYQWRKDGENLSDSDNIFGSRTTRLRIVRVRAPDAGLYTCAISTSCGTTLSDSAPITLCPADFGCDGSVSVQDIYDFIEAWFAGDLRADMDGSGVLTGLDVLEYIGAWFVGCP